MFHILEINFKPYILISRPYFFVKTLVEKQNSTPFKPYCLILSKLNKVIRL